MCVCVLWLLNHLCTSTAKPQPQSNRSDHFICLLFDHPFCYQSPIKTQFSATIQRRAVCSGKIHNYYLPCGEAEAKPLSNARVAQLQFINKTKCWMKKKLNCIFDLMTIIFAKLAVWFFFHSTVCLFQSLTMCSIWRRNRITVPIHFYFRLCFVRSLFWAGMRAHNCDGNCVIACNVIWFHMRAVVTSIFQLQQWMWHLVLRFWEGWICFMAFFSAVVAAAVAVTHQMHFV